MPIEIPSASEVREESISENRSDRPATGAVRWTASLGPVARMIVRQTALTAPAGSAPATNFEVDEFYWLHVRPGSVSVDARWKINVRSGRLQQFTLAADPRWRPLAPAEGAAVSQIHAAGNDPGVFVVELAHPAVGRATIDASFLLIGASGVGHWPQPPFEVHDATVNSATLGSDGRPGAGLRCSRAGQRCDSSRSICHGLGFRRYQTTIRLAGKPAGHSARSEHLGP